MRPGSVSHKASRLSFWAATPLCPILILLALGPVSCGGEAPATPSFTVRDSAGIVIVENQGTPLDAGGGWGLSSAPILEIGAMEGEDAYQLYRVRGAFRLSDGRVAVVNHDAPDLRIFAPDGTHLHTFGRKGEGPGEFTSPVLAGILEGDTLVVVDDLLRRINLFHPERGFIRSANAEPEIVGYLLTVGMFSKGTVVIWRGIFGEGPQDGHARRPVQYRSVSLDGALETDFGEFPGNETVLATRPSGEGMVASIATVPFGRRPKAAVRGNRLFFGSQDSYEVRVYRAGGELVRLVRVDRDPVPVLAEHLEALVEARLAGADDDDRARAIRRSLDEMPVPEVHPAHGDLHADPFGYFFVEDYRLPGEDVPVLSVFDPEGRMVGSLTLPEGLRVLDIGEGFLLGLYQDELDVEFLRLYRLDRPGGP